MIKICEECKKQFDTKSPSPKQCPECREKLLTRVCEICRAVFKARSPNAVRPTCGKQECINASISRKFTPERKEAQGAKLAERNRNYFKSLTPEQQKAYSEKMRENAIKQFQNETPEAKAARKAKEMETKANWSNEQKAQYSKNISSSNKKRYASMSEQDFKELLGKRFKHLTNIENFDREFILLNFADENGVIPFENREKIKEYFNLKTTLIGLQQLLTLKFDLNFEKLYQFSFKEKEIVKYLKDNFNYTIIENDRKTIRKSNARYFSEIDILIKQGDTIICGVEYNGIHFHDKSNPIKEVTKSNLCAAQGFPLFHIWEDSAEDDFYVLKEFLESLSKL